MSELVPGKRTFIERGGVEFELPEQHSAKWIELQGARCLSLHTPQQGGWYYVESVDEETDRVVVHLGDFTGDATGIGTTGAEIFEPTGYPFPSE